LQNSNNTLYLHSQNERDYSFKWEAKREISSAGSEHLVYTEGVGGSNPSFPTKALERSRAFFVYASFGSHRELVKG
jgi:hypothetical protein